MNKTRAFLLGILLFSVQCGAFQGEASQADVANSCAVFIDVLLATKHAGYDCNRGLNLAMRSAPLCTVRPVCRDGGQ